MIKFELEIHSTSKELYNELFAGINETLELAKKEFPESPSPTMLFKSSFNPNKKYVPHEKRRGWFHRVIRKVSK